MSTEIGTIKDTGKKNVDLDLAVFWGGDTKGRMLQVSQGFGMDVNDPGFIQLTILDCYELVIELTKWLKDVAEEKAKKLEDEIKINKILKNTVFEEAVKCERFISELKTLEIPLRLLEKVEGKNE